MLNSFLRGLAELSTFGILTFSYSLAYVWFMMFKATFNNISVLSWRSVLLVEETGVPRETHQSLVSYYQTLSHNVVSSTFFIWNVS
jgi:hypothetical protein